MGSNWAAFVAARDAGALLSWVLGCLIGSCVLLSPERWRKWAIAFAAGYSFVMVVWTR